MKAEIHPTLYPVVFIDGDHEIITRSTKKSGETREIDGVEHYMIPIDISAFTHPFFTGKQRLLDTEGRVERFRRKFGSRRGEKSEEA
jgi:large subunit ribosomal protein L31